MRKGYKLRKCVWAEAANLFTYSDHRTLKWFRVGLLPNRAGGSLLLNHNDGMDEELDGTLRFKYQVRAATIG